ncbi:hypothetical protein ACLX1H_004977 [Fusarium chlamydosporum]
MPNTDSSSDPRVQNTNLPQLVSNFEELEIRQEQTKSECDEEKPYQKLPEGVTCSNLKCEDPIEDPHAESLYPEFTTEMFSGQLSANWYVEAISHHLIGQTQNMDEGLADQVEDISISRVASLTEDDLRYIATLLMEKPYQEAEDELMRCGLSYDTISADDLAKIVTYVGIGPDF